MKTFNDARKLINDLQNNNVFNFRLPRGGRGFVKKNGDMLILKDGNLKRFGYFMENSESSIMGSGYHFVSEEGFADIAEEIVNCDKEQAKDLLAFAIKLALFFYKYPDYKSSRDYDFDVLLRYKPVDKIGTPLAKVGFKIF